MLKVRAECSVHLNTPKEQSGGSHKAQQWELQLVFSESHVLLFAYIECCSCWEKCE